MRERIIGELRDAASRSEVDRGALDGAARSARRDCDQHDRRVLPVAAARVPARGGRRPRVRHGGRDRGAAARSRSRSISRCGSSPAWRDASRTSRWCWRSSGCRGRARAWPRCSTAASSRGARSIASWRAARPISRRRGRLPARADGAAGHAAHRAGRPAAVPRGRPGRPSALSAAGSRAAPAVGARASRPMPRSARCVDRVAAHFLTGDGRPRAERRHPSVQGRALPVGRGVAAPSRRGRRSSVRRSSAWSSAFARDLNAIMARGIKRMFAIALSQYRRALDERSVLDFSDVLQRALDLLRQMDEFAQSRYRLESRYHHVLVDEFQDTSRAQWELVSLLVQSWGEGLGLATRPSVFIVGDRKQSIYRFRDAEVAVLQEAGRYIEALRPGRQPAAIDRAQLPGGAGAAGVRQRRVHARCRRTASSARRVHLRRHRPLSGRPVERRVPRSGAGHRGGRRPGAPARRRSRRRSRAFCARTPSATAGPACRGRRRPATSPSCSDRAPAIGSSSTSSSCSAFRPTSTRAWASSTPTRPRTSWRWSGIWRGRCPTCARRRSCGRASSGCRIARWRAGAAAGRGADGCRRRLTRSTAARRRGSPRARCTRARRSAAGCSGSIACRRPICSRSCSAKRRTPTSFAGRTAPAGVGEPQEDARHDPADPEPRLRDAAADRGAHRRADRGRRVERGDRGARRRQPDDRPRVQGARVPDRLRRQHGQGRQRPAQARSA